MVGQSAPPPPYVGERAVDAAWLEQRETALVALRTDYEAQRAQAQTQPGPWWVTTTSYASGDTGDTTTTFDEAAFRAHYIAGAVSRNVPALQTLASLYATDVAGLLRQAHVDQLVVVATGDHAINAGPAPAGLAMGDARQLAALDLYMADPQIRELIDTYGGTAPPATDPMAREQVRLLGQARFEQLGRLNNAMAQVRDLYAHAITQAERSGEGPGWVERTYTVTDPGAVGESGEEIFTGLPATTHTVVERRFDHDVFTAWYGAQSGAAQRAFGDLYGASQTTFSEDSSGLGNAPSVTHTTQRFANEGWVMEDGVMRREGLERLNLNDPPRLNDRNAVYFDPEAGWFTPQGNVHENNTLELVAGVIFVAAASYVSFNTLGPWAAGVVEGATGSVAVGSLAGVAVVGAAGGAASAFVGGAMSGNLTLRDLLRGTLSGALSATLTTGLIDAGWIGGPGSVSNVIGRMTVQGGINALLGGSFSEGAATGFASALADAVAVNLNQGIANLPPSEAAAARYATRIIASAIRALGNPNDPQHAFASDLLNGLISDVLGEIARPPGTSTPGGSARSTVFDDEGNLMPGVTSASAPWEDQLRDIYSRLIEQGMDPASAEYLLTAYDERVQDEALSAFVEAQPDPRLVAGIGATPQIRSARDIIDDVESRMAAGTLNGEHIGAAINEAYDAFLRLGAAAEQAPDTPSRDAERVATRLMSLIGDLGRLAEAGGTSLTQAQSDLVRQAQAIDWSRFWSVAGDAAGLAAGPLAVRRLVATNRAQLAANLSASGQARPSANHQAHHIIPFGDSRAAQLRARLRAVGIDVNDSRNGIWLRTSGAAGSGTAHNETMRRSYFEELRVRFTGCVTQSDYLRVLNQLRTELTNGTIVLPPR